MIAGTEEELVFGITGKDSFKVRLINQLSSKMSQKNV